MPSTSLQKYFTSLEPWASSLCVVCIINLLVGNFCFKYYPTTSTFWSIISLCSLQYFAHVINTIFDFVHGVDTKCHSAKRELVDGILTMNEMIFMSLLCLIAAIGSFYFMIDGMTYKDPNFVILLFSLVLGIFIAYGYTGDPFSFKYFGFGELCVIINFGFYITVMIQTSLIDPHANIWSNLINADVGPMIFIVTLINVFYNLLVLHSNNMRDIQTDKDANIITIAILLGKHGSDTLYSMYLFLVWLTIAVAFMYARNYIMVIVLCLYIPSFIKQDRKHRLKSSPKQTNQWALNHAAQFYAVMIVVYMF